jgi:hypothetical protein
MVFACESEASETLKLLAWEICFRNRCALYRSPMEGVESLIMSRIVPQSQAITPKANGSYWLRSWVTPRSKIYSILRTPYSRRGTGVHIPMGPGASLGQV